MCAALLGGCSLFETETDPANVYLPADPVDAERPYSSSSSEIKDENQYGRPTRPSSSSRPQASSSTRYPTVTPPEQSATNETDRFFYGKWYYSCISYKRKLVYRRLYNCAKNNEEECDVSDLDVTKQDIYEAFWAFDYENPQFLELGSGYELNLVDPRISNKVKSIKISYGRSSGDVPQTDFENRAETVLEEARSKSTDYERLRYVHDWIVDNTEYSKTGADYESEADGPIVYGKALCEGYSKAFMYFAQELGYPCICSVGVANREEHMWNMVFVGGAWYNVDVTWDDPKTSDGSQELRHDYFLINDAQIRLDHRVEHPIMLPNAPNGYFPYGYDQDGGKDTGSNSLNVQ